ncbi:MAG: sensor histidine kinase [Phycisphaerae bacterium]|nr:sensor histidine kinase [Phycisphaerae bacterium]
MEQTGIKRGSVTMRPRARLIRLIGDELISDEPVALVELVKNAYDADATRVEVRFEGENPDRPQRIVVSDDGIGMDLQTVLTVWLEPATIAKRGRTTSPRGRPYQGAKGIGRFATARLAKFLLLESKSEGVTEAVHVLLDWGAFDDHSYLDDITVDYETLPAPKPGHWTRLTLETLRKTWAHGDYEELHARLSRLISPFDDVDDFNMFLAIPAHPDLSGEVQPPKLILKPRYLLRGELDTNGKFTGSILTDGKLHRKFDAVKLGDKVAKPLCGPFRVEIRAWDRDPESLEPLVEKFEMGVREIRQTLNAFCGVSIYRDGFRVYPYGQRGNDWLSLDIRSRLNPPQRLANNQIVGAIRITRETNPELKDRSTREGMVLNTEHAALEKWYKEILSLLETERYRLRPRRERPGQAEPLFEAFDLSPTVHQARRELGKDHPIAHLIARTEMQVKSGVERVQEVFSRLLMSAGLGHMVDIVIHEIGAPLGKVNRQLVILEKRLAELLDDETWASVLELVTSIKGWLEQIHNLRQRLDPQTPAKRGRATLFSVQEEIEDNLQLYEALLRKQNIKTQLVAPPGDPVRVKMARASLGQIMANLIDNSIYWIVRERGPGNGGAIHIRLWKLEHGFAVLFCDDGPGVPPEDQSRIFEPYFTRKPNGIGLGLYIARLVIEPYGRLVYREDRKSLSGACFETRFEQGVGV